MNMKLHDIAAVQIGYQHRDKAQPISATTGGTHRIIQIKDLDIEGRFRQQVLSRGGTVPYIWTPGLFSVTPAGNSDRYRVGRGDLLFLSRGQRTLAVPVLEDLEDTIASYYFYVLRPRTERVLPEYLAWFINQPSAQAHLESRQLGTYIKTVPKSALDSVEVAVPPLPTQRAIAELERLRQKEEHAMSRLAAAKRRLADGIALEAATARSLEH